MATWQYDITLVPTSPVDLSMLKSRISDVLPSTRSWSDSLLIWGDIQGNRIDLLLDSDEPELAVRFDLRRPSPQFVRAVLSLAKANGFILKNDQGVTVPPTVQDLVADMMQSDAFRFVTDASGFLESLEEANDS